MPRLEVPIACGLSRRRGGPAAQCQAECHGVPQSLWHGAARFAATGTQWHCTLKFKFKVESESLSQTQSESDRVIRLPVLSQISGGPPASSGVSQWGAVWVDALRGAGSDA